MDRAYNQITADVLDLIDGLQLADFDAKTAESSVEDKAGSIFYRIFWDKTIQTHTRNSFETYLLAYPDGLFIEEARFKIDSLKNLNNQPKEAEGLEPKSIYEEKDSLEIPEITPPASIPKLSKKTKPIPPKPKPAPGTPSPNPALPVRNPPPRLPRILRQANRIKHANQDLKWYWFPAEA